MSYNEKEVELEEFKDFLDLYESLKEEMENYSPSKSKIIKLLEQMLITLKEEKTL